MFREMHLACVLQAGTRRQAGVLPATETLELATIDFAKALELDVEIGSLEVGKRTDFAVVGVPLSAAPFEPAQVEEGGIDPVSVHSYTAAHIDMVVVKGVPAVEDGRLVTMDEGQVVEEARRAVKGIRHRAEVRARPRQGWNMVA